MGELVLTTYDWVPEPPRGHVRDIRARWAMEEAGLPYRMASVPFDKRGAEHIAHQPFAQVPWLMDGDLNIFESGAILLHLGELSDKLMPTDERGRSETQQWLFAALNSMEMVTVAWSIFVWSGLNKPDDAGYKILDDFLALRLGRVETVLAKREWLVDRFSIADIAMSDVLRLVQRFERLGDYPACRDYIARATARPAFKKAHADQMAHFAKADEQRKGT